jgi:hypothetical protein
MKKHGQRLQRQRSRNRFIWRTTTGGPSKAYPIHRKYLPTHAFTVCHSSVKETTNTRWKKKASKGFETLKR